MSIGMLISKIHSSKVRNEHLIEKEVRLWHCLNMPKVPKRLKDKCRCSAFILLRSASPLFLLAYNFCFLYFLLFLISLLNLRLKLRHFNDGICSRSKLPMRQIFHRFDMQLGQKSFLFRGYSRKTRWRHVKHFMKRIFSVLLRNGFVHIAFGRSVTLPFFLLLRKNSQVTGKSKRFVFSF